MIVAGSWIAIIPARFNSSRFPGKPLVKIKGKTMLSMVIEACRAANPANVIVATDHEGIYHEAERNGAMAVMTPENCKTGSLRCLYAWDLLKDSFPDVSFVVNVQGDEPGLFPENIKAIVYGHRYYPSEIITMYHTLPLPEFENLYVSPEKVKTVMDAQGKALYFSRSPIPFRRGAMDSFCLHSGIYGFPVDVIERVKKSNIGVLSAAEDLEQLSWMEAGLPLRLIKADTLPLPGIDTPEDLERFIMQRTTNIP
jgi:3-deoxy-manno-octulosonate cytidylyltransferase (CMP-KDO synthetase)